MKIPSSQELLAGLSCFMLVLITVAHGCVYVANQYDKYAKSTADTNDDIQARKLLERAKLFEAIATAIVNFASGGVLRRVSDAEKRREE